MVKFKDFSIRVKLTSVVIFTSIITLSISAVSFLVNDLNTYKKELAENYDTLSRVIADNSAPAVAFEDDATATEVLQALNRDKHIMWAAISLKDGSTFASFLREDQINFNFPSSIPEDGFLWTDKDITVKKPIIAENEEIATLWIQSDLLRVEERLSWFLSITGIICLATLIIGFIVAYFFQRYISRPIQELEAGAKKLAVGNFDYEITYQSKDEIGNLADTFRDIKQYLQSLADASKRIASRDLTVSIQARSEKDVLGNSFKEMITNLSEMVEQLHGSATLVVTAAGEIKDSSDKMSEGAKDQAHQVNQVSAAVEEMTATIIESSKNAADANEASRNASENASSGGQIVAETIIGMTNIAKVVKESAETTGKLADSAEQIGQVIGVIDDIADQTNLLALNAAIEAARAGEQGRGFAVVADEVRKLAERTSHATSEISEMIKGIQSKTKEAVTSMEAGIKEVDQGRELSNQAGNSLEEIVKMSEQVMHMIEQISTASEEQANAAENVAKRIESINSVTNSTARQTKESSDAAAELNRQAEELQEIVASFKRN